MTQRALSSTKCVYRNIHKGLCVASDEKCGCCEDGPLDGSTRAQRATAFTSLAMAVARLRASGGTFRPMRVISRTSRSHSRAISFHRRVLAVPGGTTQARRTYHEPFRSFHRLVNNQQGSPDARSRRRAWWRPTPSKIASSPTVPQLLGTNRRAQE